MQTSGKQAQRATVGSRKKAGTGEPRCILTSEPPSVLQGPLWPLLPEVVLRGTHRRGAYMDETV